MTGEEGDSWGWPLHTSLLLSLPSPTALLSHSIHAQFNDDTSEISTVLCGQRQLELLYYNVHHFEPPICMFPLPKASQVDLYLRRIIFAARWIASNRHKMSNEQGQKQWFIGYWHAHKPFGSKCGPTSILGSLSMWFHLILPSSPI